MSKVKKRRLKLVITVVMCMLAIMMSFISSSTYSNIAFALQSNYGLPSWWNNAHCDSSNNNKANPIPLYTWRGIEVCTGQSNFVPVHFVPNTSQENEFQCTELVKRYLLLAFGIPSLGNTDGRQIVSNYTATSLIHGVTNPFYQHSVYNDGHVKLYPIEGDVLSFSPTSGNINGHTAIVIGSSVDGNGNGTIKIIQQNVSSNGNPIPVETLQVKNWIIQPSPYSHDVLNWMTTREVPPIPGGVYVDPTPSDGSNVLPGNVPIKVHAFSNSGDGLNKVNITSSIEGSTVWNVLKSQPANNASSIDVSTTVNVPNNKNVLISFDVYATLNNMSPHGIRRLCPTTSPLPCSPYNPLSKNEGGESIGIDVCRPNYNQITFFTDKDYSGQCAVKDAGEYGSPEELGIANDSVSSIKAGSDAKAQVCDNNGLSSPCQWFDAGTNISDLQTTTIGDNHISSAKILDLTQAVTLCSDPNYSGNCKSWDSGSVDNLALYGLGGTVSSVKVGSKHTLYMYSGENHQGTPSTWDQNVPDLSVHNWNDLANSFKIEPKLDVSCSIPSNAHGIVVFKDPDYGTNGGCKFFDRSVQNLGNEWHTHVSSVKFFGNFINTKKLTFYTRISYEPGSECGEYTINQSDVRTCSQVNTASIKVENYTPPAQAQNISQSAVLDPSSAGNAVDKDLDTEWIGGNKYPIGFSFEPVAIKGITIYDRKQSSSDNNQINKARVEFSDGTIVDNIDMTSGGPRCAQINFPAKTITWYRIIPSDASGDNGFREIETWDTNGEITSECVMKFNVTPQAGEVIPPTTNSQSTTPTPTPTEEAQPTPKPTATPTPEPTQEVQQAQPVVFDDFQSGSGWGLTNSQYATEEGNTFVRMTPNTDAESWKDVGQAALQNYNTIQFRIRTNGAQLWANEGSRIYLDQGGRWYYVTLRDKVDLNNSDWQTIEIPLSEFEQWGFDRNQSFDRLGFQFHYENATVNIDVDDIVFIP